MAVQADHTLLRQIRDELVTKRMRIDALGNPRFPWIAWQTSNLLILLPQLLTNSVASHPIGRENQASSCPCQPRLLWLPRNMMECDKIHCDHAALLSGEGCHAAHRGRVVGRLQAQKHTSGVRIVLCPLSSL